MTPSGARRVRVSPRGLRNDVMGAHRRLAALATEGGTVRARVLGRTFSLVTTPDAVREVLVSDADAYGRSFHHANLGLLIGNGLICSEGETWQRQRRATRPLFGRDLLEDVTTTTARLTSGLLDTWASRPRPDEPLDVEAQMRDLTIRIITALLFGEDTPVATGIFRDAATVASHLALRRNANPFAPPLWVPTRLHRQLRRYRAAADRFLQEQVTPRLDGGRPGLAADLARAGGTGSGTGSGTGTADGRRELCDQVMTLYFAGFETTATALAWIWLELGQAPAVLEQVHAEVSRVLQGRLPAYADLATLPYTHQVVQEALRLHPPVYAITRRAHREAAPGGSRVDPGESVIVPVHLLHTDPRQWEQPESFRPERFAPGSLTSQQRRAYVPFGGGPRTCIGAAFATAEMMAVLAVIIQRACLHLVPGYQPRTTARIVQYPADGVPMTVHLRDPR